MPGSAGVPGPPELVFTTGSQSFVSVLSEHGIPIVEISRLVGHKGGSNVTELIYRKQIGPVIQTGAQAMDDLFGDSA